MSIRKTKKRLKREIDRLYLDKFSIPLIHAKNIWEYVYLSDAIQKHIDILKQELQQLNHGNKHGSRGLI